MGIEVITNFSANTTTLDLRWTDFYNNYYGIYSRKFHPDIYTSPSKKQNVSLSPGFRALNFQKKGEGLMEAYSGMPETPEANPHTGIAITNWPILHLFPSPTTRNLPTPNNFDQLQFGIRAYKSDMMIQGSEFYDITDYYGEAGKCIYLEQGNLELTSFFPVTGGCLFSDSDYGVHTRSANLDAKNAYFDEIDYGITAEMHRLGDAQIYDCSIDYNIKGISASGGAGF